MTQEKLAALHDYEISSLFTETERRVLRYADQLTATPVTVDDNLFSALKKEFSEAQLVELTEAIAWENHRARFNHAFGIESEGFSAGAFCPVPVRLSAGKEPARQAASGNGR